MAYIAQVITNQLVLLAKIIYINRKAPVDFKLLLVFDGWYLHYIISSELKSIVFIYRNGSLHLENNNKSSFNLELRCVFFPVFSIDSRLESD